MRRDDGRNAPWSDVSIPATFDARRVYDFATREGGRRRRRRRSRRLAGLACLLVAVVVASAALITTHASAPTGPPATRWIAGGRGGKPPIEELIAGAQPVPAVFVDLTKLNRQNQTHYSWIYITDRLASSNSHLVPDGCNRDTPNDCARVYNGHVYDIDCGGVLQPAINGSYVRVIVHRVTDTNMTGYVGYIPIIASRTPGVSCSQYTVVPGG